MLRNRQAPHYEIHIYEHVISFISEILWMSSSESVMLLLARLINRQDVVFRSAQSIAISLSVWSALISPAH